MNPAIPQPPPVQGDNICLVGMMGSGKSTIGAELARELGLVFVDLDDRVVASLGRSIPDIFEQLGERRFRQEESIQLRRYCRGERQVIACGGGAVMATGNRKSLRSQTTIYLKASSEALAHRLGTGDGRPLLQGASSITQRLTTLLAEREEFYLECAQVIIDSDRADPLTTVRELLSLIPSGFRTGKP